ncbi:MAG TPA: nuclear transport factor 2 family protein [Gemmatimonadales bacterium]|jgi:ketosteroid isomerase-like protein
MAMALRIPIMIAVLAALPNLTRAQAPSPALAAVAAFHSAMEAGDSATVLSLLHPDVVVFESGRMEAGRDEYRSHHLGADMEAAQGLTRDVTFEESGGSGDVAWVIARTRTTGAFRGREIDSEGDETMVLRHTEAGWRIVHIHWSQRPRR